MNVSRLLAPLGSPVLALFMAALDAVNAEGDGAPGFLWRLQTEDGNATAVRAFGWDVSDSNGHVYGHLPPDERRVFLAEAWRVATELVVVDSALRPGVAPEEVQERILNDGFRHRVHRRYVTGPQLAAEIEGELLCEGTWFVAASAQCSKTGASSLQTGRPQLVEDTEPDPLVAAAAHRRRRTRRARDRLAAGAVHQSLDELVEHHGLSNTTACRTPRLVEHHGLSNTTASSMRGR